MPNRKSRQTLIQRLQSPCRLGDTSCSEAYLVHSAHHRAKCQSFYGKSGFACFRHYWTDIDEKSTWSGCTARRLRVDRRCRGLLSNFLVKFQAGVFFPFVSIALANFLHVGSLCLQCSNVLFDVIVSACVCSSGRKFANLTVDKSACRTERALNTLECSPDPWVTDHVDKTGDFRSVVSSGRLKCTKTEIFRDDGGSDDRSHSTSAQSLTHHRCIFVSKHFFEVTSFELRTTDCLESNTNFLRIFPGKVRLAVSCVGNVWKCLSDARSHILTAVVTARVSANNRNHNANHSTEVEWDASGWMTDLNAPRSDCSCTDTVSCSELSSILKLSEHAW